ncbi:TetR family transcriptional regulator [Rhodococcus qingshengii]
MPPDSTATKKRLLDAALVEFAQHGLAGARVDRIALAARANKRLIYVYFTNKEQLFDTVVERFIEQLNAAVAFTPADLSGYAGALFDHLLAHPEHLRLTAWAQLERPEIRPNEFKAYERKVGDVAASLQQGSPAEFMSASDVLALVLGLATSWFYASPALKATSGQDPFSPERLAQHRVALTAAVEALVTAPRR